MSSVVTGYSSFLTDDLLVKVHARLGLGVDLTTFSDGTVEARWKRDYDGEWSDERFVASPSLTGALQQILDYEDAADEEEGDVSLDTCDDCAKSNVGPCPHVGAR